MSKDRRVWKNNWHQVCRHSAQSLWSGADHRYLGTPWESRGCHPSTLLHVQRRICESTSSWGKPRGTHSHPHPMWCKGYRSDWRNRKLAQLWEGDIAAQNPSVGSFGPNQDFRTIWQRSRPTKLCCLRKHQVDVWVLPAVLEWTWCVLHAIWRILPWSLWTWIRQIME